jgi:hypothetical protein
MMVRAPNDDEARLLAADGVQHVFLAKNALAQVMSNEVLAAMARLPLPRSPTARGAEGAAL